MSKLSDFYLEQQVEPQLKVMSETMAMRGNNQLPPVADAQKELEYQRLIKEWKVNELREDKALLAYHQSGNPADYHKAMGDKEYFGHLREMDQLEEQYHTD